MVYGRAEEGVPRSLLTSSYAQVDSSFASAAVTWHEPAPRGALDPAEPGSAADLLPVSVSSDFAADAVAGYVARRLPLSVPTLKANPDKPNPKVGVGLLQVKLCIRLCWPSWCNPDLRWAERGGNLEQPVTVVVIEYL